MLQHEQDLDVIVNRVEVSCNGDDHAATNQLLDSITDEQWHRLLEAALQDGYYLGPITYASARGNFAIVSKVLGFANEAQLHYTINKRGWLFIRNSITRDNLDIFNKVFALATEEQTYHMIHKNWPHAIICRNEYAINRLLDLATEGQKRNMIASLDIDVIVDQITVQYNAGNRTTANQLLNSITNAQWQQILETALEDGTYHNPIIFASEMGNFVAVGKALDIANEAQLRNTINKSGWLFVRNSITRNNLGIFNRIFALANEEQTYHMIHRNWPHAIICRDEHAINRLLDLATEGQKRDMIASLGVGAFTVAIHKRDLNLSNKLWDLATEGQKRDIIASLGIAAFDTAIQGRDLNLLNKLLDLATEEQKRDMIASHAIAAFAIAIHKRDLNLLNKLWNLATEEEKHAVIAANDYAVVKSSTGNMRRLLIALLASEQERQAVINILREEPQYKKQVDIIRHLIENGTPINKLLEALRDFIKTTTMICKSGTPFGSLPDDLATHNLEMLIGCPPPLPKAPSTQTLLPLQYIIAGTTTCVCLAATLGIVGGLGLFTAASTSTAITVGTFLFSNSKYAPSNIADVVNYVVDKSLPFSELINNHLPKFCQINRS